MNSLRTSLYRDKQNAKLMGVCAGIAEYTGVNAFWVRLAALMMIGMTGGWIIPLYFIAGIVLNKKPPFLYRDAQESKYWEGVRQNPARTARDVRSRFRELDRRLADVETYVTSSNSRLAREIEQLR